jgi:hypothetical protein
MASAEGIAPVTRQDFMIQARKRESRRTAGEAYGVHGPVYADSKWKMAIEKSLMQQSYRTAFAVMANQFACRLVHHAST